MPNLVITGRKRLYGELQVQGAKNSVLPVLAATILLSGESVIHNCPDISDVDTSVKILTSLGCRCAKEGNTVTVDSSSINNCRIPDELMREMRSSVVFLGAILSKMGRAEISSPGGCELGPRPIDLHISSLIKLGADITEDHGYINCTSPEGLSGCEVHLSFPSVGATENIILAAACAKGTTIIHNAAREPEISDLADFLNSAGARIYGCGSDTVVIYGVSRLGTAEHSIIPDRIVAATYMAAAAVTNGSIVLHNTIPSHLVSVISVFRDAGCRVQPRGRSLCFEAPERLIRVPTVRTLVHPGFPTDAGPLVIAALSLAHGTSVFVENIFENRFKYVDELNRLGAHIKTEGRVAVIEGVTDLSAAPCECTDLRGGAALVVAALAAHGNTVIEKIQHIKRGYDNIAAGLNSLGGCVCENE